MSKGYFINNRVDGRHIGNSFYGGKNVGKEFGFTPLNENLLDHRVVQPGYPGYGRAMLEYWDSVLEPETPIEDRDGQRCAWLNFRDWLLNSREVTLGDRFVGNITLWRGREEEIIS